MDASQILFCGATMGIPLIAVLICVSLMTNEVKHCFICLFLIDLWGLFIYYVYESFVRFTSNKSYTAPGYLQS